MQISRLASAVYNDVVAGLAGYSATPTIFLEQLEDDVVDERLLVIKEFLLKDLVPKKDLMLAINCIPVDCKSLDRCCGYDGYSKPIAHFQIPQLVNDIGTSSIEYVGSVDRMVPFTIYTSRFFRHNKTRLRGQDKPYVYIEPTPNENNMYDGYIFNAPMLDVISVVGIFKDPRQLEDFSCCLADVQNFNFLDNEIKKRVTEKKLRYYRQNPVIPRPNDQIAK